MAEWISVEERLPDDGIRVIVADCDPDDDAQTQLVTLSCRCPALGRWVDYGDGLNWRRVTHWMPLPEPPKIEETR